GLVEAAEQVHQGGFAGAGGTHDGNELAVVNFQVHVPQHRGGQLAIAVGLADALEADQGSTHAQNLGRGCMGRAAEAPPAGRPPPITTWSPSSRPSSTSALTRVITPTVMLRSSGWPLTSTRTRERWPSASVPRASPGAGRPAGCRADTGMLRAFRAEALTKKTWALICGSSLPSGLGTSNRALNSTTLLTTSGVGSIWRSTPSRRTSG